MAFLDYIMEAANALAQEMMSLTLDFFTNLVQWCASASYSFWDASLVNVLLQAGAGVSILVWAVAAAVSGVGHITYDVSQSRQPSGPGLAGAGGSLDCSRFIKWAYWTAGFMDWDADSTSTYSRASCVRQIARSELQPGDIAMLEPSGSGNNHVRIYIGSGYWVESCYGHGACINNWTDEQNGGHAYRQFWRYVGFD